MVLTQEQRDAATAGGYTPAEDAVIYQAVGCAQCGQSGYAGRFALHENFEFTPATKAAFISGMAQEAFRRLAIQEGMRTAFAEAVRYAVEGVTSLDEIERKVPGAE